jgi:hypothetical protein
LLEGKFAYFLDGTHNSNGVGSSGFDFDALTELTVATTQAWGGKPDGAKGAELAFVTCKEGHHGDEVFKPSLGNLSLAERKKKAYESMIPTAHFTPALDQIMLTEMLISTEMGFGPSPNVLGEMQFHWDAVTQAKSIAFFETSICTKREEGGEGVVAPTVAAKFAAKEGSESLNQAQSALIDALQLTQRLLERKHQNPLILFQVAHGQETGQSMRGGGGDYDSKGQYEGVTCDHICELKGYAFRPTVSARVTSQAWLHYVTATLTQERILNTAAKHEYTCSALAERARGLTATVISAAGLPITTCPPDLGLCKCHPASELGKITTFGN